MKLCQNCDLYAQEDIEHIIMQCPRYQKRSEIMFKEIFARCPNVCFESNPSQIFGWIIGKQMDNVEYEELCNMWTIAGITINYVYKEVVKERSGMG